MTSNTQFHCYIRSDRDPTCSVNGCHSRCFFSHKAPEIIPTSYNVSSLYYYTLCNVTGGLTEARRVVAMAAARDILVIPHGSSVYSYHLQYAFTNCPLAEFINLSPDASTIVPYFGGLFPDEPLPKDGFIDLDPAKPGFGVTLNQEGLVRPHKRSREKVQAQFNANANREKPTKPHMPFWVDPDELLAQRKENIAILSVD